MLEAARPPLPLDRVRTAVACHPRRRYAGATCQANAGWSQPELRSARLVGCWTCPAAGVVGTHAALLPAIWRGDTGGSDRRCAPEPGQRYRQVTIHPPACDPDAQGNPTRTPAAPAKYPHHGLGTIPPGTRRFTPQRGGITSADRRLPDRGTCTAVATKSKPR